MTAVLTAPAQAPDLLVVLVAPTDAIAQCDAGLQNVLGAGAVTVACEVDVTEPMLAAAVAEVLRTVDDASVAYPGLAVVLVGHAGAGGIASMAASACGDDIAGLVLTDSRAEHGPQSEAA